MVDATRASLGLPVVEYIVTDAALQVSMDIAGKIYFDSKDNCKFVLKINTTSASMSSY